MVLDGTQRDLELIFCTRRYSTVFHSTERYYKYSRVLNGYQQYPKVLTGTHRDSKVVYSTQGYSMVLGSTQRSNPGYSTVLSYIFYYDIKSRSSAFVLWGRFFQIILTLPIFSIILYHLKCGWAAGPLPACLCSLPFAYLLLLSALCPLWFCFVPCLLFGALCPLWWTDGSMVVCIDVRMIGWVDGWRWMDG